MSDLSCPATVLLARHARAEFVDTFFSDEGGWLGSQGRAQAAALAEAVRGRRVARVWSSDTARAVQTAELVAAAVPVPGTVPVLTRRALREVDAGDLRGQPFDVARLREVTDRWFDGDLGARFPGGESGHEVVARYADQLAAVADEHRGECVLVVAHQTAASVAVPLLTGLDPAEGRAHELACGTYVELAGDADGWRLVGWGDGNLLNG